MNKFMRVLSYRMFAASVLLLSFNYCYGITNNRKDHDLRGPVYAVVVKDIQFAIEFGEITPKGYSNDTLIYFLKDGNAYMESCLPTRVNQENYSPKRNKRFYYDRFNNLVYKMTITIGGGESYYIGSRIFNRNDTTDHYHYQYAFNNDNTISEVKAFYKKREGHDMQQLFRVVYTYNSDGRREAYYKQNGIDKEIIYKGNTRITKDFITIKETLNKNEKPISTEYPLFRLGGNGNVKSIFTYNEHGDEVKVVSTQAIRGSNTGRVYTETKTKTTQYIYDKNGNWTRKLIFKDGTLISWQEREIFYASSDADYLKVIRAEENAVKLLEEKEQHLRDSISKVEAMRDSVALFEEKLADIFEKEFLQKHITSILDYNSGTYKMGFVSIDKKIRDCTINGNTIVFSDKKGKINFDVEMSEFRICRYSWDWDTMHEVEENFWAWYSQDLSDILLYIEGVKKKGFFYLPMMFVLHKDGDNYLVYSLEKDANDKIASLIPALKENQIVSQEVRYLRWKQ